jgi:hypothetical protein
MPSCHASIKRRTIEKNENSKATHCFYNRLHFFLSWSPSASQIIEGVFVDANIMIIH